MLIAVSPELVAARLAKRDGFDSDRIGGRDAAYHARVAAAFGRLAEGEPGRFVLIDGDGDPEQIHQRVLAAVLDSTA